MQDKIITAFQKATFDLSDEIKLPIFEITETHNKFKCYNLISNIGLTGEIKGNFLLAATQSDFRNLASHLCQTNGLLSQHNNEEELFQAAFAEFANQLAGRALMYLSQIPLDCNLTPPTILSGEKIIPDLTNSYQTLTCSMKGEFGYLTIILGLEKSLKKTVDK